MVDYRNLLKKHLAKLARGEGEPDPSFSPEEEAELDAIIAEARQNQISGGLSPERALDLLRAVRDTEMDVEDGHVMADAILCSLLEYLGHREIVEAWKRIDKSFE